MCLDKRTVQTDILFTLPNNFYFEFWHSAGTNDSDLSSDFGDEIDWILGKSFKLKNFNIDLGIAYYDYVDLLKMPKGDVVHPHFEINKTFSLLQNLTITPYSRIKFPLLIKNHKIEKGTLLHTGVKQEFNFTPKLKLNNGIQILYDDGTTGAKKSAVFLYDLALNYKITKKFNLNFFSLTLATPLVKTIDRETETIFNFGIAVNF